MTRAAAKTLAAADALLDWLHGQSSPAVRRPGRPLPPPTDPHDVAAAERAPAEDVEVPIADVTPASATDLPPCGGATPGVRETGDSLQAAWDQAAPLRLAHTDWLYHRLTITGPPATVAAFEQIAAGAGVIPWQLDLDRLAEDAFHVLIAPPPPLRRSLSAAGARILADQLRAAVARRHDLAIARVGRSLACPFDLQPLIPVPADVLRLGPDDPAALAWLWTHWGTTQALRHVASVSDAFPNDPIAPTLDSGGWASGRPTGRPGGHWRSSRRGGRRCASRCGRATTRHDRRRGPRIRRQYHRGGHR